jgi:L-fuconolactonase
MRTSIVDSHQHFWQVGRFDYPWMSSGVATLYQDYLPERLEPLLKEQGVAQSVVVQASNSIEETRWMLSLADEYPFIAGVVGWLDLMSADVGQQLEELTAHRKFKGVRHLVESEPDDNWLIQQSVLRGLNTLSHHGVSYDLLVHTRHLRYVKTVAERCPELRLIIDHMAKPPIAKGEIKEWARALKEVATYENVSCKLSGLVTEADHASWRTEDLRPYVESALELFGVRRLMFGSDWPICLLAASYGEVLESFQSLTSGLSEEERALIFAENAKDVYRLQDEACAAENG